MQVFNCLNNPIPKLNIKPQFATFFQVCSASLFPNKYTPLCQFSTLIQQARQFMLKKEKEEAVGRRGE